MFWRHANRRDCQGTKPESSQETAILPAVPKAHFVVSGICIHISDSRLCAVRAADHRTAENPSEAGRGGATGSHAAVNIQLRIPSLTASHTILSCVFNNLQGRVIFSIELSRLQRRPVGMYNGLLNRCVLDQPVSGRSCQATMPPVQGHRDVERDLAHHDLPPLSQPSANLFE
jgi:hypothetical protein